MATIGMRYVVAAPISTESGSTITYGTKQTMKAVEASLNWERDDGKMYADDADAYCEGTVVPAMEQIWNDFISTGRAPSSASGRGVGGGISVQRGK